MWIALNSALLKSISREGRSFGESRMSNEATIEAIPVQGRAVPTAVKMAYTAFMAVLVPVYWYHYGPTNFLYFCDMALFLVLFAVWRNSALAASAAAVGIVVPQLFWCVDFAVELTGNHLSQMTSYMMDDRRPLFLRSLSLFHGWLPFLLLVSGACTRLRPAWSFRLDRIGVGRVPNRVLLASTSRRERPGC